MFELTFRLAQPQSALALVFENSSVTCFVDTTMVLGQLACLRKEKCLYADADWLKPICQSQGGDRPVQHDLAGRARSGDDVAEVF